MIFQPLPINETVENVGTNRMKNGCIVDALTSVDVQETVKFGGKVIKIFQGVIYKKNFEFSPFREGMEKMFASKQKSKRWRYWFIARFSFSIMRSLYDVQIRINIKEFYKCKSQKWMETGYDDNVLAYWSFPNRYFVTKLKHDDGLDDKNNLKNTWLSILGALILSISKELRIVLLDR